MTPEEMKKKGTAIRNRIERLREHIQEQNRLLGELDRAAQLFELGIDPRTINRVRVTCLDRLGNPEVITVFTDDGKRHKGVPGHLLEKRRE